MKSLSRNYKSIIQTNCYRSSEKKGQLCECPQECRGPHTPAQSVGPWRRPLASEGRGMFAQPRHAASWERIDIELTNASLLTGNPAFSARIPNMFVTLQTPYRTGCLRKDDSMITYFI